MKKRRNAPLPDDVCMCLPELGRVCVWCQNRPAHCPWNPDELPDRLKGYGYRVADQDGGTGEEWVTPQEDFELTMIEAARVLLDAKEI